jgi:hypothetical protein
LLETSATSTVSEVEGEWNLKLDCEAKCKGLSVSEGAGESNRKFDYEAACKEIKHGEKEQ